MADDDLFRGAPPLGGELRPDPKLLEDLARATMPFGRYKGTPIVDLPLAYLGWFQQQGLPPGKLGQMLGLAYEVKLNGLGGLVKRLR